MSDEAFRWVVAIGVWLAAIAFIIQAGVVSAIYTKIRPLQQKILGLADRAEPIVTSLKQMLEENRPKVAQLSTRAAEIAGQVKEIAVNAADFVRSTTSRAKQKIEHVEQTIEHTMETVHKATSTVQHTVSRPVKEVQGIYAGVRAAISTLAHPHQGDGSGPGRTNDSG